MKLGEVVFRVHTWRVVSRYLLIVFPARLISCCCVMVNRFRFIIIYIYIVTKLEVGPISEFKMSSQEVKNCAICVAALRTPRGEIKVLRHRLLWLRQMAQSVSAISTMRLGERIEGTGMRDLGSKSRAWCTNTSSEDQISDVLRQTCPVWLSMTAMPVFDHLLSWWREHTCQEILFRADIIPLKRMIYKPLSSRRQITVYDENHRSSLSWLLSGADDHIFAFPIA